MFLLCFVAGPPLHETIKLLSPLTNLEELDLSFNKSGGAITADLAVFSNLEELGLANMNLDGKICMSQHTYVVSFADMFHFFYRRISQGARQPRQFEMARVAGQWLHRYDCMSQHTCVAFFC